MTERNNIEIDYCPSCRGVWLDKGELDKMLDYAAQKTAGSPAFNPNDANAGHQAHREKYPVNQHGYRKPYKKKSFLGDLFDFD